MLFDSVFKVNDDSWNTLCQAFSKKLLDSQMNGRKSLETPARLFKKGKLYIVIIIFELCL